MRSDSQSHSHSHSDSLHIHEKIRHKIVRNEIPPGERITIDALARELGVSHTPIREALQRLEGEHLVSREPGRGYATTPLLTERQLQHMFEVRMLIEPWACRVVAVDRAWNPGRSLLALIDAFEQHHDNFCSRIDLAAHDTEFHSTIHSATGNDFLVRTYNSLHAQAHLFRLYSHDVQSQSTLTEHRNIATAIAACDGRSAHDAMHLHLQKSLERYMPALQAHSTHDFRTPLPAHITTI